MKGDNLMKKIAIVIILVVMLFVGCNIYTSEPNQEDVEATQKSGTESITLLHEKDEMITPDENQVENNGETEELSNTLDLNEKIYSIFEKRKSFQEGDLVTFGNYAHSEYSYIPIQWVVLEEKNGALLLLSLYGISVEAFYDEYYFQEMEFPEEITWENSTVRAWLNDVFFQRAFYKSEQECIKNCTIYTQENSIYGTSGGENTKDYIFLLSEDEAKKYFCSDEERITKTVPAVDREYNILEKEVSPEDYDGWWLRSPGESGDTISYVTTYGEIVMSGTVAWDPFIAVRPAMWVDLNSVQQYSNWLHDSQSWGDARYVDEISYQQILRSLPEYETSSEPIGLSYKTVKEMGLYDNCSSLLLEGKASMESMQLLGEQWCRAEENTCIREKRGNYSMYETSDTLNTIFMRYEYIWDLPCEKNHYTPRFFLIKSIDGTNQISEIKLEGYVKNNDEKVELVDIINDILKMMNANMEVSLNGLCGSYQEESFKLLISNDVSLYGEEMGEYYCVRFY